MKASYPLIFLLLLLLSPTLLCAQSWQWGRHGGSTGSIAGGSPEEVVDMATDPHGNVYLVASLNSFDRFINGVQSNLFVGPQYGGTSVLVSFDCNGTFRWSKVFATKGRSSEAVAVATDQLGGVYLVNDMVMVTNSDSIHLDLDTTFSLASKRWILVKYDTSGVYQWHRMPQPDNTSLTSINHSRGYGLSVSDQGDIYWYCQMQSGLLGGSSSVVADSLGPYILHYNSEGDLLDLTPLEMFGTWTPSEQWWVVLPRHFARDHQSGRFYVAGQYGCCLTLGGQPLSGSNYVGAFDSTGQFLWLRQSTIYYGVGRGFRDDPEIDQAGNIYLVGTSSHNDQFGNYQIVNSLATGVTGVPFAVALDSSGNNLWATNGSTNSVTDGDAVAISRSSNGVNEVAIGGSFPRQLIWAGDTLSSPPNYGYDPFLARFDANGNGLGLTSLPSLFGFSDYASALTADAKGNFYLGGRMAGGGEIYVASDTLNGYGGNFDFFVAKFGTDNCALCTDPIAEAATSYDSSSLSVPFQFTGAANYDSLVWTFGDGSSDTAANPTHVYAQPGAYTACVRVFNACGSDSACLSLTACLPTVADFTAQDSFLQVAFDGSGSSGYDSLRWTFGDGSSDTALAPTHTYAQPGSYEVCLQAFGFCGVDSLCDSVVVEQAVGIAALRAEQALAVYPNPSYGAVSVAYHLPQPGGSLTIYDVQGRVMREEVLREASGVWRADIGDLPEGLYLVVLRRGGRVLAREKLSLRR